MKMTRSKKSLSLILCMVLVAAMALFTIGCSDNNGDTDPESPITILEENKLGKGDTKFIFTVVDGEGKEAAFEISTDKTTVGDALLELGLIAGDAGPYGLYVKTVNGITADSDKDGKYWAFYVNGEYAMTGVDTTKIAAGETYTFKVE